MTPLQYLLSIKENDYRKILGLAVQMGIVMMAMYAGTLYPPEWINKMYLQYYIPSVFPFAVIVAFTIILAIYKESKLNYDDYQGDEKEDDDVDDAKDNDIETQRSS